MSHPAMPIKSSGLHGKHILITRPIEPQAEGKGCDVLTQQLMAWGAQVSWLPLVEIQPLPFQWDVQEAFDWLFFTSKNAVNQFFKSVSPDKPLQSLRIAVVGPATAQCVQSYGAQPEFISPQYNAESAAAAFGDAYPVDAGLRILWPCGNLANPALKDRLEAAGAVVQPLVVYKTALKSQLSPPERQLLQQSVDMLVFTSASAIDAWLSLDNQADIELPQAAVACLGPQTTQAALKQLGHAEVQANPHTLEALAQGIYSYFAEGPSI